MCLNTTRLIKITLRQSYWAHNYYIVGNQYWLPVMIELPINFLIQLPQTFKNANFDTLKRCSTFTAPKAEASSNSFIWEAIRHISWRTSNSNLTKFSDNGKSIWYQGLKIPFMQMLKMYLYCCMVCKSKVIIIVAHMVHKVLYLDLVSSL